MGRKQDGRDDEINALLEAVNVDTENIAQQITNKRGDGTPPAGKKPEEKPLDKKPDEVKPEDKKDVLNPETIRADVLREMWGDQFKTVEDFKKANIPQSLQELVTLRQQKQELETQLAKKPKHSFASDDIAKFNEFARETGIKDASVFNKINATDVANMDSMDALVLQHIIENPSLAGKEPQVRRYFETRYGVDSKKIDPKRVESGDLTQEELDENILQHESNLIGITSDGGRAKAKLQELKGKIKMPDFSADEPPERKKWTPEIEKSQKEEWTKVNEAMVGEFAKIPIPMKGSKEPIVNFVLPEEAKRLIMTNAINVVVSNQMEVNEANVKSVAMQMFSEAIIPNLLNGEIAHTIFERARSMTEEEFLKTYSNTSSKNTDNPSVKTEVESDEDRKDKAYRAELKG